MNKNMAIISASQLQSCQRMLFMSPLALGDFLYLKTFLIALKAQNPHITLDIWLDDNRCTDTSWRLSRSAILQQWIASDSSFNISYGCTKSTSDHQAQIQQAKANDYDIIICHSASKSARYSQIAREIAPKAFIVSSITKQPYNGLFNRLIFRHSDHVIALDTSELDKNHHITDRFYAVFNKICNVTLDKSQFMPTLDIPNQMDSVSKKWLLNKFNNQDRQGKLYFLNHLSTNTKKDWHLSQLFELITLLAKVSTDGRFIINVTKENFDETVQKVNEFTSQTSFQVVVFTVEDHFFELPSLISLSDFVITVDTAILHFAFAAKRPLISMMRSKKPYWAPPASKQSHVLYATEGKGHVSDISVEAVYQQYLTMVH